MITRWRGTNFEENLDHPNRMRRETLDAVTPFVLYHGWISEVIHPVRAGPVLEGRLERPYRFQPPTPRASRARSLVFIRFRQLDEYRSIFRGKTLLPFPSPLDLLVIIRFSFKKIEPTRIEMLHQKMSLDRYAKFAWCSRFCSPLPLRIPL